ncbi:hypothetical protein J4558_14810 [Leptolyngbya sp. 15MV]|nr:hypothetical protein J4558_14810 [Leptolyngbya sp. 15MV]
MDEAGQFGKAAPGFWGKVRNKTGDVVLTEIVSLAFRTVVTLLLAAFGYGALVVTEIAPPPREIVATIRGDGTRAEGIREVKAVGEGPSGAMASSLQLAITRKLRPVTADFGGVRIEYALGAITSGRGASSATTLRWALARSGSDWLHCPETPLSFTNRQALAAAIADQINNGLLASETAGVMQCG